MLGSSTFSAYVDYGKRRCLGTFDTRHEHRHIYPMGRKVT